MKKGCFIKLIVFLTIIIAAVLYIVQHKFDEFILSPGKKILKELIEKETKKKLIYIKNSPEKDSLKLLIEDYILKSKINDFEDNNFNDILTDIKVKTNDSIIDKNELLEIKNLLNQKVVK